MRAPKIACSELALSRFETLDAWHLVCEYGIDGIEVFGTASSLRPRLRALRTAKRAGVVFSTVCGGPPFIAQHDETARRGAIRAAKLQITIAAELETGGAVMPVGTPPFLTVKRRREVEKHVVATLVELSQHAESEGTRVFLEPLNRYEDGAVNRLQQANALCDTVGSRALSVVGDFFHMNIEEDEPSDALRQSAGYIQHVHLADSNRLEPGAGHLDFGQLFRALKDIAFEGWLALECSFQAPLETTLPRTAQLIRETWAAA